MAGQSDPHFSLFSAEELEFVAEDDMVEIVPNLRMDALNLISGDFGPFAPQIATQVPLWLALALKKRGKCSIRPPEWMSVDNLTQVVEAERDSQDMSEKLPFHYVEISRLLFDHARDDIPDVYMVRSLIEDIRNVRFHKVRTDLEAFNGRTIAVKIKNLSAMEVNIVRPFIRRALQAFCKHDSPELIPKPERVADKRAQAVNNAPRGNIAALKTSRAKLLLSAYFRDKIEAIATMMINNSSNIITNGMWLALRCFYLNVSLLLCSSSCIGDLELTLHRILLLSL